MLWTHHQNASRNRRDAAERGKTEKLTRAELMEVTKQATSPRVPSHLDTGASTTDRSSISQFRGCEGRGFTPREDELPRVPLMEMNYDNIGSGTQPTTTTQRSLQESSGHFFTIYR
jgi:hypothetical protein